MNNIFKDRLLLLATFLDTLPAEKFDFRYWVGPDWKGKSDLSCGTTACALGWATTIPELADAGLTLVKTSTYGRGVVVLLGTERFVFENENSLTLAVMACEKVFGLSFEETQYLFTPNCNVTLNNLYGRRSPWYNASAKDVADHIRNFVSKKFQEGMENSG